MRLSQAATTYVDYKQAMGMRFITEACTLKSFCTTLGDVDMDQIKSDQVADWLAGSGVITLFYHRKLSALRGLYRFALARDYTTTSPLPMTAPQNVQVFVPYIYSLDEIRRLLDATAGRERCNLSSPTCRTLLLLLYGSGLRISEAIGLNIGDVDLQDGILLIRESKFYKTRLMPVGADLKKILVQYAIQRHTTSVPDTPFLLTQRKRRLSCGAAEHAFRQFCIQARVRRDDHSRYQPRLQDLRHAFAVSRLVSWYREGADVQRLLPQLATYLGHVHIAATQHYLTMTPELLREASQRFEHFALGGNDHA
jgi:integrase/recombinase XerD